MAKYKRHEFRSKQQNSQKRFKADAPSGLSHHQNRQFKTQKNTEMEQIMVDDIHDYLEDYYAKN